MQRADLERLQNRLRTAGLPATYVSRLERELIDHASDIVETQGGDGWMEMGAVESISDAAIEAHRSTHISVRMPWFVFLVAPIPLACVCWGLFHALTFGAVLMFAPDVSDTLDWQGKTALDLYPKTSASLIFAFVVGKVLPLAVVAYFLTGLRQARAIDVSWHIAAMGLLVLFGGFGFVSEFGLPVALDREASFRLHPFRTSMSPWVCLLQCLQGVSPIMGAMLANCTAKKSNAIHPVHQNW